jgi:hypothetical protein
MVHVRAKMKKEFQEWTLTHDALIPGVEYLVNSFSNKLEMSATNDLPLSAGTLTRKFQDASNGLQRQLSSDVNICFLMHLKWTKSLVISKLRWQL